MNKKHSYKLTAILVTLITLALACALVLYALKQNINLFYTPTELHTSQINTNKILRLGGLVQKHSIQFSANGSIVKFIVTDNKNEINVVYNGVLPNLFREGQGVVVSGKLLTNNFLQATQVLAKHDENYKPFATS